MHINRILTYFYSKNIKILLNKYLLIHFTFSIYFNLFSKPMLIKQQNQLSHDEFIARVWQWKYFGIFTWVSISYMIYILCTTLLCIYFQTEFSKLSYLFPLVFLTASAPLYFYSLSLTVVPIRHNVWTLKDFCYPFLYFISQFTWIFFHLLIYLSDIREILTILKYSGFIILILFLYLDFTIILVNLVSDKSNKRFTNRYSAFKELCLFNFPILPLIISFSYFYFKEKEDRHDLYVGLIVTSTIYISFFFTSICSLIAGEKVSFSRVDNGSRLEFGLKYSKSQVVKYWAYCDFLDISNDDEEVNTSRRKFIFANIGSMGSIITTITKMISDMAESHNNISTDVRDWKKFTTDSKTKLYSPLTTIKAFFKIRWANTMDMKKEWNAAKNSIIAMVGIEGLVRMIFHAEKEDQNGEIQQKAEIILNSIIDLYRSCMKSQALIWKTPQFGRPWIVTDYQKLTVEVLNVTYKSISNLIAEFGDRFDMTIIKNENKKQVDSFMKYESNIHNEY